MIAVKSTKELACCRCKYRISYKGCNGWTCSLTNETGYPCYADAFDKLDSCPFSEPNINMQDRGSYIVYIEIKERRI